MWKRSRKKTGVASLPGNFWAACVLELLERLAFFGVRAIVPLYLVRAEAQHGLALDFQEKGLVLFVWALLQCVIPMLSGALTDRYGYRKSLSVAFSLSAVGYVGMGLSRSIAVALAARGWQAPGFWVFLLAASLVAIGTAIFKPAVQGTIARCTAEETSSVAWGVFYWIVNVGAAVAPMCAAILRADTGWENVFYAAAIVTGVNFLFALLVYQEPEVPSGLAPQRERHSVVRVLADSARTIVADRRLLFFLACFSGFWLMFMQLWDLLPNFIDEWVDTSDVAPLFGWINTGWILGNGQVKPELIITVNAFSILLLVIPVSWAIARHNKAVAMVLGMVICVAGFVGSGATTIGWVCCAMIFMFSLGEMACSPTFSAYIGLIAPPDKKALYMGYSSIPFAVGWASGSALGGVLYQAYASKVVLARRYLVSELGMDADLVMDQARLAAGDVLRLLASTLGTDIAGATHILWERYDPWIVWSYLGVIGAAATLGMLAFYALVERKQPLGSSRNETV